MGSAEESGPAVQSAESGARGAQCTLSRRSWMGTRQQPGTAFPSAWQPALITPPPPEAGAHYGRCCLFVLLIDAERLRAALLLRSRLRPSVTRRELSSAVSVAWKCNARSSRGDLDQTSCIALLAPHRFSPRSKISSLCQRHPLPRHLVGPFHGVGEDGECMVSTHLHVVSPRAAPRGTEPHHHPWMCQPESHCPSPSWQSLL